jgi:5-carboxymethyl-2-hydroxymuconate isomerase
LKEGRPLAVQQELADRALATLRAVFDEVLRRGAVSISVDVRELRDAVGRTVRSIPGAS